MEPSPSVEYYGFNTTKAPFSDVHVRRAFELGIDWRRIVILMANPLTVPATGMVPAGVPGHSEDFGPKFDLARAKSELAAAGYPNGVGFPKVTMITTTSGGQALERAIIRQLHDNLGIDIAYRAMDWEAYNARLLEDPPDIWTMGWVADYPGANDFLGHPARVRASPTTSAAGPTAQFDQAIARSAGRPGRDFHAEGFRRGPGDRSRPGARDPGRLRRRLRAGGEGPPGGVAQQPGSGEIRRPGLGERIMKRVAGYRVARSLSGALVCALLAVLCLAGPVAAASPTFGTPTASSKFGTGITFTQPYSGATITSASLLVEVADDLGPGVIPLERVGSTSLTATLDTSAGGMYPNTPVTGHFEVVLGDGTTVEGPDVKITYDDDRFTWKELSGKLVTLHYIQASGSFAQQLLKWADDGARDAGRAPLHRDRRWQDTKVMSTGAQAVDVLPAVRAHHDHLRTPQLDPGGGPGHHAFDPQGAPHGLVTRKPGGARSLLRQSLSSFGIWRFADSP